MDKVNLNTATMEELQGIGLSYPKAYYIIDYREKNGGFKDIRELRKIWGIGQKTYEKFCDWLCV